jgi:deoxyribonuclease-4
LRTATILSLINDLQIAEACGSLGVVVHFGKWKGKDALTGYRNVIDTLNEVLREWKGNAQLLIENQAGEGSPFGTTLEELTQIRKLAAHPERIGFCFDTCHAFASGLWTGGNLPELLEKGDALGYFEHLRTFHLNDSEYPRLSGKDRHAVLGLGYIGEANLRRLTAEPRFRDIPAVLETPVARGASHREQLEWLRQ